MALVEIHTADDNFRAAHPKGSGDRVVVEVGPVVETTFAGQKMVRFTFPDPLPSDWQNRNGMIPAGRVVSA